MGFYDEIAKDINWELTSNTEKYLTVVGGKLQLPNPKWLQYHLNKLDSVIEAIHAFREGVLVGVNYDIDNIEKRVIHDSEEAKSFLRFLTKEFTLFSIDIESRNLSTDKAKNKMLCIGIAYAADKGVSFMSSCFDEEFTRLFAEFVNNSQLTFILHNGVFDRSRTKIIADMDIKIDEDTLLMHYTGINEHKGTHGLKDLAQLYLGFPDWEKELDEWKRQYCKKNKIKLSEFQYDCFPQKMLAEYNVVDCCATYQLFFVFKKLMRPSACKIYRKLVEASKYYADMISRGMLLDATYWNELKNNLEAQKKQIEEDLAQLMPGVSPTSPVQLKRWLVSKFPYDGIESTGKEVIDDLAYKYPEEIALQKILDYRKVCKYLKTYVDGLWARKDYQGFIHCEFKLFGTETGRLSSSNPNMQNIPRNKLIKNLFRARPGYLLLQLDYSQAELRTLAHISQDDTLTQVYIDGRDLHSEMAQKIFGDKFDPHDKDQRMAAKIVNFGIPYGRTPAGVAKQLKISKSEAKEYLEKWFAGAPKVKDYIAECHRMATAEPQEVYYTVFGRARHYYITSDSIRHAENQSVNFPISSTANDLTIHSLVEIGKWLIEKGFDAYLVNTVHDSIILEVREKDAKEIAEHCQLIMSSIPKKYLPGLKVPFRADAELGTSYGELSEPDWYGDEEEEE